MTDAKPTAPSSSSKEPPKHQPAHRRSGGYAYAFSFRWLLVGLAFVLVIGTAVGGLYLYRMSTLTGHVVSVARHLLKESDELIARVESEKSQGKTDEELRPLRLEAFTKKEQAANLLLDYRRQHPDDVEVSVQLLDLLENMQTDFGTTPVRRNQILDICKKLLPLVPEKDSLPYRQRILELEWENGDLVAVLERAKDVLVRTDKSGQDNYSAWRYLTMAIMFQLGSAGYPPQLGDSALALPPSVDELLETVHRMKPEDLEISVLYSDFIKDSKRRDYWNVSSEALRKTSDEDRGKKALSIINDMVNRNEENSKAYLARYRFKVKYDLLSKERGRLDSDLEEVLRLGADDSEGLVLAGMLAYQQSLFARQEGNLQLADERKAAAEEFYLRDIKVNPTSFMGYQHLGDFYMNERNPTEAVRIWKSCLEKNPTVNQEIIGRLVLGLIQLKQLDDANEAIGLLDNVIKEYRQSNQLYANRVQNLVRLLSAKLYDAQASEAITRADALIGSGKAEDAKRFYTIAQKKYADASQILEQALGSFGSSPYDYVMDPASIHSRIIGESLILTGRLAQDRAQWDVAASYFQRAARFPQYRDQASVAAANAYQQMGLPTEATQLLAEAVQLNPDNVLLRNIYAQSLFRQEVSRVDPATRDLDAVEKQFRLLAEHKDRIFRPWTVDFRLIHLDLIRESSSLDPDRSIRAVHSAVQKYKALESALLPVSAAEENAEDGEKTSPKKYSDDLTFLAELAGVYSSLSALPDFERILLTIRDFPDGEPVYFDERIGDALRRNDKEGAILVIEEAQNSDRLTPTQRQRFVSVAQRLKDDQPQTLDKVFENLKNAFDQNPDAMRPQVFFLMANMALDREDLVYAKILQERLETIEGESGTMWRFIKARSLMIGKDPPMDVVMQLQQEILDRRPDWDMIYTLKATVEEQELTVKPDDKELKWRLIDTYRQAIRCGNTQQALWNRLLFLLEDTEQFEEVRKLQQDSITRGVRLETAPGQFPQPYQRLYTQVYSAIVNQDPQQADLVARQCLVLAQNRRVDTELIYSLNLGFGKLFLDNDMIESAKRHLVEVAKRGSSYVYPLAVCLAKDRQVDAGFTLILDEIDRTPSSVQVLLPSILVLLAQVRPSEAVMTRIDRIITRIEHGERPILRDQITTVGEDNFFDFGVKRIHSMTVRFPDSDIVPDPETLILFPPEEEE